MIKSPLPPREPSSGAEKDALGCKFERRVRLSWLSLLAEWIWEALLWPFIVVAAFLIVSLFELWSLLPPLVHRGLLGAFALALLLALVPLFRIRVPARGEALRRLEQDGGISHRPASSYEDRIAPTAQGDTLKLWGVHRERLARTVAKLRPSLPRPRADRNDPYALRSALLLLLVVGILVAGNSSIARLKLAFAPVPTIGVAAPLRLEAWVTPPVYVGQAPIVLADGNEPAGAGSESFRALSVPERSELTVRAHAPQGESVSLFAGNADSSGETEIKPKGIASGGLIEFSLPLTKESVADVRVDGSTVAKWHFALIKDEAPKIALMGDPGATPRGALRLQYRASDDHGVASAEASFALAEGENAEPEPAVPGAVSTPPDANALTQPPVMPLQLPHANAKEADGTATQDLTSHPWAGLKVRMTLIAHDQAGQTGASQPYEFILPERQFTKPLARAVIEQRKKLVRDPDSVDDVGRALDALTFGDDRVIDDHVVYLGLRDAYWRLQNDRSADIVASVVGELWEIALHIEDGDLPDAERELKAAQDRLSKALKENASPDEIKKAMADLKTALSHYLQSLAQQAQQKGNMPQGANKSGDQLVSQQDLDKLLNNIQQLAQSGANEMAQRMLDQLKDILNRMQAGNFADDAKQQRMSRMMNDLSDLVSKQQKLLDDTFKTKRQQPGNKDDQFEVSPPGSPMDFGGGMDMQQPFQTPDQDDQDHTDQQQGSDQGAMPPNGNPRPGSASKGQRAQGGQGNSNANELGNRQADLQKDLQSLIDRLRMEGADAPNQFQGAHEAMDSAKQALGRQNLDRATDQQGLALDRLRQGAQAMAAQMEGQSPGKGKGQAANGSDPLGRPDRNGTQPDLGLSVKVPEAIDVQRAREVLDELRRRLGDPSRPTLELDYLERLIKPY